MVSENKLGFIHVITGDGKGKTTSAMGIAIRALGQGLNVKIIQLFKQVTGEFYFFDQFRDQLKERLEYVQFRKTHPNFKKYSEEDLNQIKKNLYDFLKVELFNLKKYNVLIIDEIGSAIAFDLIDEDYIIKFIEKKPKNLELVLTGRSISETITRKADYISEIIFVKHPYIKGVWARAGIEY
ncbi:MAG: cob(I)yrinic acid a,c-diamide adenosyltransferase [Candidatus Woesearchaeota archaeon]